MGLNRQAAVDRAASVDSWHASGLCLQFVDWCFGNPGSNLPPIPPGGVQDARQGWDYSQHQRPYGSEDDYANTPAGVPVYFPPSPWGSPAGHIVVSTGNGWCRTTDYPGARQVSSTTIAELSRIRSVPAWGWTEDYLGVPIDLGDAGGNTDAANAAAEAAAKAAADKKRRNNVALPLIAQQAVAGDDQYGLNIAIWDDGVYYWVDGAQRDVWFAAGAAFINCEIPGRFEYLVYDAELRQGIRKGLDTATAKAGAEQALAKLVAAASKSDAPKLLAFSDPTS